MDNKKENSSKLLTPAETAERLSVKESNILYWLRKGELKGVKIGRQWRIRESDLEEFIRQGEMKAREDIAKYNQRGDEE